MVLNQIPYTFLGPKTMLPFHTFSQFHSSVGTLYIVKDIGFNVIFLCRFGHKLNRFEPSFCCYTHTAVPRIYLWEKGSLKSSPGYIKVNTVFLKYVKQLEVKHNFIHKP